jgi:hypothetical protein
MFWKSTNRSKAVVACHLGELQSKIDEYAARAGISPSERLDLRSTLAALGWSDRRRLGMVLEGVRTHASSPALREAVSVVLRVAAEVWANMPPPSERPTARAPQRASFEFLSRWSGAPATEAEAEAAIG